MKLSVRKSVLNGKLRSQRPSLPAPQVSRLQIQTRNYGDGKHAAATADREVGQLTSDVKTNRDFYLSVLSSTSGKREARSYLQRFTPASIRLPYLGGPAETTPKHTKKSAFPNPESLDKRNEAYVNRLLNNRATRATAEFLQPTDSASVKPSLVPKIVEEELHAALVKIRDIDSIPDATLHGVGKTLGQLQRLGLFAIVVLDEPKAGDQWRADANIRAERITAAIENYGGKARRVDGALTMLASDSPLLVSLPQLILAPLSRGVIPILTPLAFDSSQTIVHVDANDIVQTLTKLLSTHSPTSEPPVYQPISLDRLIFLDPLGGIPAPDRPSGAHVFVNLQQEYADIEESLKKDGNTHHLKSLQTIRSALALLPPTTSAVITTPDAAAAAHAQLLSAESEHPRIKNPLIHNLLTDKPIFSSSLPTTTSPSTQTTLIKHGTPLLTLPRGTKLTSPEVDLPKLVALIEDSFGKTLDVEHYLNRVNDHIAGLIIAGDYEGAAIITWETPPGNPSAQKVCYLDKFAVARRSQGVGGVADVVFKAMTAGVQPGRLFKDVEGIVWRSRRNNPVNKWYFERAKGTWKLPEAGDMWTMFWTTEDVKVSQQRFSDYADVCRSIQPSLRDRIRWGTGGGGGGGGHV